MGLLGSIAGLIPGVGQAISLGSGIVSAISGAKKGAKADKLQEQRLAQAQQRFNAAAPFRQRLADLAKRPTAQRQDMSAMIADPGNPYSRARPSLASLAQPAPAPMPPAPMPQRPMMPPNPMAPPMAGGRLAQLQQQQRMFR